ncbi:hypothetical protein LT493_34050 [Streptomyces tricolor]|nr:hypothetical protein [Streptomyces tricolor]
MYVRPDMAGYWSSRTCSKSYRIPSGSGGVLAGLPRQPVRRSARPGLGVRVGRQTSSRTTSRICRCRAFGEAVEKEIHELVQEAAELRAEFQKGLDSATRDLFRTAGVGRPA